MMMDMDASSSSSADDIDNDDCDADLYVTDYVHDIYCYLRRKEGQCQLPVDYMTRHMPELTLKMRVILVDWLTEVAVKFKLLNDTYHMTIALIDHYLASIPAKSQPRSNLQLMGITCMLIASKFEEIYSPEVRDFVYICDNAYSDEAIREMERVILNQLQWHICYPHPLLFLRRFNKAARATTQQHTLAKYLLELALVDGTHANWYPSHLAASVCWLAGHMMASSETPFRWTRTLQKYTAYDENELEPCVAELRECVRRAPKTPNNAIYRKYSGRFFNVARIPLPE